MKCSIEFELDDRVLTDNSATLLGNTVLELTNAFYAWRRKAQCEYLGHTTGPVRSSTTTDHNGRCLRCLGEINPK